MFRTPWVKRGHGICLVLLAWGIRGPVVEGQEVHFPPLEQLVRLSEEELGEVLQAAIAHQELFDSAQMEMRLTCEHRRGSGPASSSHFYTLDVEVLERRDSIISGTQRWLRDGPNQREFLENRFGLSPYETRYSFDDRVEVVSGGRVILWFPLSNQAVIIPANNIVTRPVPYDFLLGPGTFARWRDRLREDPATIGGFRLPEGRFLVRTNPIRMGTTPRGYKWVVIDPELGYAMTSWGAVMAREGSTVQWMDTRIDYRLDEPSGLFLPERMVKEDTDVFGSGDTRTWTAEVTRVELGPPPAEEFLFTWKPRMLITDLTVGGPDDEPAYFEVDEHGQLVPLHFDESLGGRLGWYAVVVGVGMLVLGILGFRFTKRQR